MSGALLIWILMGVVLVIYVLTGGADFGAGVLDLVARGPQAEAKRAALQRAIAPIWEANHVWLIFLVVLAFTVFPVAFHVASIALHIPLTLALVGIVLRGAAFVFRAYGFESREQARWGRVFAWASTFTPVFLGASLAALATGAIRFDGRTVSSGFLVGWTSPFAWGTGAFCLALFTMLAAVYMTVETEGEVRESFRRDALAAELVAGVLGLSAFAAAYRGAPPLIEQLARSSAMLPVQALAALSAFAVLLALGRRAYRVARVAVVVQVAAVVLGFGLGMRGYLIYPDVPLEAGGAEAVTLHALAWALPLGSALLVPSLLYLFRVFKSVREG